MKEGGKGGDFSVDTSELKCFRYDKDRTGMTK